METVAGVFVPLTTCHHDQTFLHGAAQCVVNLSGVQVSGRRDLVDGQPCRGVEKSGDDAGLVASGLGALGHPRRDGCRRFCWHRSLRGPLPRGGAGDVDAWIRGPGSWVGLQRRALNCTPVSTSCGRGSPRSCVDRNASRMPPPSPSISEAPSVVTDSMWPSARCRRIVLRFCSTHERRSVRRTGSGPVKSRRFWFRTWPSPPRSWTAAVTVRAGYCPWGYSPEA